MARAKQPQGGNVNFGYTGKIYDHLVGHFKGIRQLHKYSADTENIDLPGDAEGN